MHMADALIAPGVGAALWAVTAGLLGYCSRVLRRSMDSVRVPMMGMLGAFIFAAQMINFSIPGTGSSGHLGGGLILAVILGPHAGFIVISSVLLVQALLFADGGLLALGCNVFNLGFFPCFVAYPLVFRPLAGAAPVRSFRFMAACVAAAAAGLLAGALCVVLETWFSGISELPFRSFSILMLSIHLAIGAVEGIVTAGVVSLVSGMERQVSFVEPHSSAGLRTPAALGLAAVITAGFLSWFASTHPDGLEWAIEKTAHKTETAGGNGAVHEAAAGLQERLSVLPGYSFREEAGSNDEPGHEESRSALMGRSLSGLVGGAVTLAAAALAGFALKRMRSVSAGA